MKLSAFLNSLLVKARTRADKENVFLPSVYDRIKPFVKPIGSENHFIQFSNVEKLGINPKYFFPLTPLGIYGHQLNDVTFSSLLNKTLLFDNYPWIHLFKWKGKERNLLRIGKNYKLPLQILKNCINEYLTDNWFDDNCDANKHFEDIKKMYREELISTVDKDKLLDTYSTKIMLHFEGQSTLLSFFKFVQSIALDSKRWNYTFRKYGINGIIDNGKIISYNINQSVFLTSSVIQIIESFPNPGREKQ